jgi:opacity protein-like surface antigen
MSRHRIVLGTLATVLIAAAPLSAQQRTEDWQYKWFWGVHGGMLNYSLPTSGATFVPQIGGEWLITARSVALFVGYSQTFTAEADTFAVSGFASNQTFTFDGMRRLQVGIVAFIGNRVLQPYAGAGFTIHTLTNIQSPGTTPTVSQEQAMEDAASGGFGMVMAGVNYRMTRKLMIYGQFQYTPQGRDFLLAGGSTSLTGGVRYAFLNAKADDSRR